MLRLGNYLIIYIQVYHHEYYKKYASNDKMFQIKNLVFSGSHPMLSNFFYLLSPGGGEKE